MAFYTATDEQVKPLLEMFGIEANHVEELIIHIKVGEVVRAYARVLGSFDMPFGEALAEVLGTASWKAEEVPK